VGGYLIFEIPGFGQKNKFRESPRELEFRESSRELELQFPSSSRRTGTLEFLTKRSGPTIRFQVPILF
jgi:hypothetical protein